MATHSKRVAEGIGRRPGVVCGVSTLITLLVSVLALVVGEFTVSADNDGWQSRTTELANRQMQLEGCLCHRIGPYFLVVTADATKTSPPEKALSGPACQAPRPTPAFCCS